MSTDSELSVQTQLGKILMSDKCHLKKSNEAVIVAVKEDPIAL